MAGPPLKQAVQEIESQDGRVLPIAADVTKSDLVTAMVVKLLSTWGRIDFLVNSAGIEIIGRLGELIIVEPTPC